MADPRERNRRLFVALEPPEPVRRRLAALAVEVRRTVGRAADDVRWVAPENVHLTVQFLGAVPGARVAGVEAALRAAAAAARPLALEVKGVGAFPNARRPRVLWAGVGGETAALGALAADVGRRLAPLGFPPETRPFSAHLTLARRARPRRRPRPRGRGGGRPLARGRDRPVRVAPLAARPALRGRRARAARRVRGRSGGHPSDVGGPAPTPLAPGRRPGEI